MSFPLTAHSWRMAHADSHVIAPRPSPSSNAAAVAMAKPPIRTAAPRIKLAGTRVAMLGRPHTGRRGYASAWARAAAAFRRGNPWCLGCRAVGISTTTTVVDHVRPPMGDLDMFWNTANWQPLCSRCHESTKKRLEHMFMRGEISVADLWLNSPRAIGMTRAGVADPAKG